MKDFPQFTESTITLNLSQPQMKLLIACLSFFYESIDVDASTGYKNTSELIQLYGTHLFERYQFKLPADYVESPQKFDSAVYSLLHTVQESYFLKQNEFIDLFIEQINKLRPSFGPDVFNLTEGESLGVAYQEQAIYQTPRTGGGHHAN